MKIPKIFKIINKQDDGSSYISATVVIIVSMFFIILFLKITPLYIAKQSLDEKASKLLRVAEMYGRIDSETNTYEDSIHENTKFSISVEWDKSGNVQLGENIKLTLSTTIDVNFGLLGNKKFTIKSTTIGTSEVYHKDN